MPVGIICVKHRTCGAFRCVQMRKGKETDLRGMRATRERTDRSHIYGVKARCMHSSTEYSKLNLMRSQDCQEVLSELRN